MYQIYGIKSCLAVYALLCAVTTALWLLCLPALPHGVAEYYKIASSTVTCWGIVIAVLGQTSLFPLLCRYAPTKYFFPDIDGCWTAELRSNWPEIAKRSGLPPQNTNPTSAEIDVISRLFFVAISLHSDTGYSRSKTLSVSMRRNPEDRQLSLNYVYENNTVNPLESDSDRHLGAASLNLITREADGKKFEGVYWTNRNWNKALNTAGSITLKRKSNP